VTGHVNIDLRGEVLTEVSAHVVADENGRPRLEPMPGTITRFLAVLSRHLGKGPLRVVISRIAQRRSMAQNRLLWKVYRDILATLREQAFDVGERCPFRNEDDVHEAMKYLFIGQTVTKYRGDEYVFEPKSSTLTTEQFSAYLAQIVGYWAKRGIYIEMPEAA
jgi:hypothetical protein